MSPWIRRTLWALLGLVVVVGGLATWLVLSFDANRVKSMAVDWMKTQRHRTLVVDGPIQLSVFPRLAVKLSKLSLSEANRPDVFASLEEAGLAVDVLPLLHGELVVGRVSAKGVRVSFLRDAQGRSNIDDLLKPEPASGRGDAKSTSGGSQAVRFDISGVDIADLRAHIKDDLTKIDGDLTLAKLTAGHLADGRTAPPGAKGADPVEVAGAPPGQAGHAPGGPRPRLARPRGGGRAPGRQPVQREALAGGGHAAHRHVQEHRACRQLRCGAAARIRGPV